jgi:hypothetical protein
MFFERNKRNSTNPAPNAHWEDWQHWQLKMNCGEQLMIKVMTWLQMSAWERETIGTQAHNWEWQGKGYDEPSVSSHRKIINSTAKRWGSGADKVSVTSCREESDTCRQQGQRGQQKLLLGPFYHIALTPPFFLKTMKIAKKWRSPVISCKPQEHAVKDTLML